MGVQDAAQWLVSAFVRNAVSAGATADPADIRATAQVLLERWASPGRKFHGVRHLVDVLARVDELAEETHEPELVRLAAWYHGAIFDSAERKAYANKGGEDEIASAALAYDELTSLGVPAERAARVRELVHNLVRHTADPDDFDCAVLCDADLAILAEEPQKYQDYLRDVREEYAHLPKAEFVAARARIVAKLLARRSLFVSPLGGAWEEPARQNLSAELQRLQKEQRRIDAEAEAATQAPAEPTSSDQETAPNAPEQTADRR